MKQKNRRSSQISESEESEEEAQRSVSKHVSSSENSSSEDSSRPPSPAKRIPTPSPQKNVTLNPLEKFLEANRNLSKVVVKEVLSQDDDICLLEVPKTIDPAHFMDKMIHFDQKTKIKLDGSKYVIVPQTDDIKPINLLTKKLRIVHPISVLRMRPYKKHKRQSDVVDSEVSAPTLQNNLKVRHPLFGPEYKRKIVLSEEVQQKLEEAVTRTVKKIKKKKLEDVDVDHEFDTPLVMNDSTRKKKKKKKVEDKESHMEESIFSLLESHIADKHKNRKKNHVKEDAITSFLEGRDDPEDNPITGEERILETHTTAKKKNSKKSQSGKNMKMSFSDSNNWTEERGDNSENVEETHLHPKGKKNKKKNHLKEDISFTDTNLWTGGEETNYGYKNNTNEENTFETNEKKSKKKNHFKEDCMTSFLDYNNWTEGREDNRENAEAETYISPKEKKKKKKNHSIEDTSLPDSNFWMEGYEDDSAYREEREEGTDVIEPLENSYFEKKRKRRNSIKEERISPEEQDDSRKRRNSELTEARDSVPQFETEKKRKHKNNNSREEVCPKESHLDYSSLDESKSKTKKKCGVIIKQEKVIEEDCNAAREFPKKIEKKNRLSIANSTILPGLQLPSFEFDVSGIINREDPNVEDRLSIEQDHPKSNERAEKFSEETENYEDESIERLGLKTKKKGIKEERLAAAVQDHKNNKKKKDQSWEETENYEDGKLGLKQEKKKRDLDDSMLRKKIKKEYITGGESCSEWESGPKKKKKKRDAEQDEDASSSKKKRRKIKEEKQETDAATSSLISDLLNRVKSEMGNVSHRKRNKT